MLGILAINIAGFAGPMLGPYTPSVLAPANGADMAVFAATLLVFEGKMRALFSILFGAGLLLFVERAEAAGRDGGALQMRRLGWLMLFGYLHFLLLWWGDILFLYGLAGFLALAMRHMPRRAILVAALLAFALWQAQGVLTRVSAVADEIAVISETASAEQEKRAAKVAKALADGIDKEMRTYRAPFAQQVWTRLSSDPGYPLRVALLSLGETLPYMLIGILLYGSGFFWGGWSRRQLQMLAMAGIGLGGAATGAAVWCTWGFGFPPMTMITTISFALAVPHLLMGVGYLAVLMLIWPRLARSWLGGRMIAAGRMAFTNYIATSLVMTALFYGWGLGLIGTVPTVWQPLFVVLGWILMLGWSKPWLAHFRQGPLEWLWRSLTEWHVLPLRR